MGITIPRPPPMGGEVNIIQIPTHLYFVTHVKMLAACTFFMFVDGSRVYACHDNVVCGSLFSEPCRTRIAPLDRDQCSLQAVK